MTKSSGLRDQIADAIANADLQTSELDRAVLVAAVMPVFADYMADRSMPLHVINVRPPVSGDLRNHIGNAVFDPGSVIGPRPAGAMVFDWQVNAVMQVLSDHTVNIETDAGHMIPAIVMGELVKTGANPEPGEPATRARAGGWTVRTGSDHNAVDGLVGGLAGYHYAEGPGDLRIRTNDRALLDDILARLSLSIDWSKFPPRPDDPDLMERVARKAGVDLGGNPLPDRRQTIKTAFVAFFHWWWNQPGANTEAGFDDWAEGPGASLLDRITW